MSILDNTVPILRKRAEETPKFRPVHLEFRLVPHDTFTENGDLETPPHFEILQDPEDSTHPVKIAWGPIEFAPHMHRMFATAAVACQMIPLDVLNQQLEMLGAGGNMGPRVVGETDGERSPN